MKTVQTEATFVISIFISCRSGARKWKKCNSVFVGRFQCRRYFSTSLSIRRPSEVDKITVLLHRRKVRIAFVRFRFNALISTVRSARAADEFTF